MATHAGEKNNDKNIYVSKHANNKVQVVEWPGLKPDCQW